MPGRQPLLQQHLTCSTMDLVPQKVNALVTEMFTSVYFVKVSSLYVWHLQTILYNVLSGILNVLHFSVRLVDNES